MPRPTATGHGLDHDRSIAAEGAEERRDLLQRRRPAGAGNDRHAATLCQLPCRDLVAEQFERRRLRPDEGEACIGTGLGKRGVLAEEAVAGMHGIGADALCRRHHRIDVEIGPGAAAGDFDGLVGNAHVQRQRIISGMDRNGRDAGVGRRARDADGNLAAIGNQELLERHRSLSFRQQQEDSGRDPASSPCPWPSAAGHR
ncbi:hypothetical protein ACVIG9_007679 [Bradyrhizobium ottawaense]